MRANIYVLSEARGTGLDVYMACGSQQEALDYYRELTGRPGRIDERVDNGGHEVLFLDRDDSGVAVIAQYKVGIQELID